MFEVRLDPGQVLEAASEMPDGSQRLLCSPNGCPYLNDQPSHRCSIHPRRPSACREFPFRATHTPGGTYIGLSFACTAVSQKLGPPVTAVKRDFQELTLHQFHPELVPGLQADWDTYLCIEEFLTDQLCFPTGTFSAALAISLAAREGQWNRLRELQLSWLSEDIEAACQRALRGLLALMEAEQKPERAQQVLIGQAQGGRYWSSVFPGWVEPKRIRDQMGEEEPDYWPDVEPFFRHLVFRKFLWGPPNIHARICLLPLLNEIIRFWSWQQAVAKSKKPDREHRRLAIRELERRLTFHADGWEDYLLPLGQAFLQGVG